MFRNSTKPLGSWRYCVTSSVAFKSVKFISPSLYVRKSTSSVGWDDGLSVGLEEGEAVVGPDVTGVGSRISLVGLDVNTSVVGLALGAVDGLEVGPTEGLLDTEGALDALTVGSVDVLGESVGDAEGALDTLGSALPALDGEALGGSDGDTEGLELGLEDGLELGSLDVSTDGDEVALTLGSLDD